jgi:hypothetical protein
MNDSERQNRNLEKNISEKFSDVLPDDCNVSEPVWVRHHSIPTDTSDWKFMDRQFRFVLYSGIVFYCIYVFSKII